ncbi:MAG: hypothetical protein IKZ92_07180, partial [Muribaculaceae bacterium]|nr:hypothetical protein [Muribaculaceae bacterium]
PHCKHFNDLVPPARNAPIRRQKNRSRNLTYCEPKSVAKLQPTGKPTKLLPRYFSKITYINISIANYGGFLPLLGVI